MKCCFKKIKKRETNELCTVNNCSRKVEEVSNNSVLLTELNTGSLLCKDQVFKIKKLHRIALVVGIRGNE